MWQRLRGRYVAVTWPWRRRDARSADWRRGFLAACEGEGVAVEVVACGDSARLLCWGAEAPGWWGGRRCRRRAARCAA